MKKIFVLAVLFVCGLSVSWAQADSVAVERARFFPRQGSIGVGIEASPILDFVGNMFNGTMDNSSRNHWAHQNYTVSVRYFLFNNLALRGMLRFNGSNTLRESQRGQVSDQASLLKNPLSNAILEDEKVTVENDWQFRLGAKMFRGWNRLRGFYGGDIFYRFQSKTEEYAYGNAMNAANPTPQTYDFSSKSASAKANRPLISREGPTNYLGFDGFTGVEYYFFPQMCVGFEVGVQFSAKFAGRGYMKSEEIRNNTRVEVEQSDASHMGSTVNFSTVNPFYGNFYFVFHF